LAVSEAPRANKTLIVLGLCEILHFGNEGAEALASALHRNKSLACLNLRDANVTIEGIARLTEALTSNCTVSTLHLTDNGRDEAAEGLFRACLVVNKTLCHIPGVSGLDDFLNLNLKRQVSLAAFAVEGNLEGMRELLEGGVGREVSLTSGFSIYHFCLDYLRSDMLDLRLHGTSGVGEGFFDKVGLLKGRRPACAEMQRFVQVRMVACHCAWNRVENGPFASIPRGDE
jgi:hypothetical protein